IFQLPHCFLFYFRYVDIIMAVPFNKIDEILISFNSWHRKLQFTIEVGGNQINFLDLTVIVNEKGTLEFDWFHKSTFPGRYLNYLSSHPISQKKGMVDKTILLSNPKYHFKNMKFIINTLLENDYPIDFILNTMNARIKLLLHKLTTKVDNNNVTEDSNEERPSWFVLPYAPQMSDKFFSIAKKLDVKLSFFSTNKLNKFIKVQKDILPKFSNKNVVYKIFCKDCDATYVGQTGRKLATRISEHRNHINSNTSNQSVITDHRLEYNHEFDWEGVRILDRERFLNKRLNSEMLHIYMPKNGLNLKTDTEFLHYSYASILNTFKHDCKPDLSMS
ncbi:hypothetical protein ALC57_05409, partial [Trachymyrmex cornetzi]